MNHCIQFNGQIILFSNFRKPTRDHMYRIKQHISIILFKNFELYDLVLNIFFFPLISPISQKPLWETKQRRKNAIF